MASLVATAQTGDAQLEDLRSKLDGLLRDADAYGKIREALDDAGAKENRGQGLQKDALLRRLMAGGEAGRYSLSSGNDLPPLTRNITAIRTASPLVTWSRMVERR